MVYRKLIRPALFQFDPETIHGLTLRTLALAGSVAPVARMLQRRFSVQSPELATKAFSLHFPNPVGLAAGYDKDGVALDGLACLGFGHIEVGTVTPKPQTGNPRPRIFRLPQDEALINRMGFPNQGAAALLRKLTHRKPRDIRLGVNLGKGIDTSLERAVEDYLELVRCFYKHADYLAINISSPNTVGLRRLQARDYLEGLLRALRSERDRLSTETGKRTPMLIKISPDLSEEELEDAIGAIEDGGMDGVIATNTTLARDQLRSSRREEAGGLSGRPLREQSTGMIQSIHRLTYGRLPIIAVGGIATPQDAKEKLDAGASLIQLYSGLVYHGPDLIRNILRSLQDQWSA